MTSRVSLPGLEIETVAVHSGYDRDEFHGAMAPPISMASSTWLVKFLPYFETDKENSVRKQEWDPTWQILLFSNEFANPGCI